MNNLQLNEGPVHVEVTAGMGTGQNAHYSCWGMNDGGALP